MEEHYKYLQRVFRDVSPDLYYHLKSLFQFLLASICFNYDYFIKNSNPETFLLFCLHFGSSQEYNLARSREVSMVCNR